MQFDERGCLVAFKGQFWLFYFYIFDDPCKYNGKNLSVPDYTFHIPLQT